MIELIKEWFEIIKKKNWLRIINKEYDRYRMIYSKAKIQANVVNTLVDKYNELYPDDKLNVRKL